MIPKLFHLTCKSLDLPAPFQSNLNRIREYYPDYEIRVYDDLAVQDFACTYFEQYYEAVFKAMPTVIMQIDTIRYMWMYIKGGIYCDFDILFLRNFSFDEGVLFFEREWTHPEDPSITHSVHNCCFASEPGHPIWLDILEGIATNLKQAQRQQQRRFWRGLLGKKSTGKTVSPVFNMTGPNAISKIITDGNLLAKYPDVRILPGSALYQEGRSKGKPEDAYVIHQTAASWKA